MTQEEKQLLLKDLCARLPYGVKLHVKGEYHKYHKLSSVDVDAELIYYFEGLNLYDQWFGNCKPYLRPMSSMTDEEKKKLSAIGCEGNIEHKYGIFYRCQDWLNEHHFDYRELIDKGFAIEVTESNNPYK